MSAHYYKHPVTGHTFKVAEEWLPVLDALERAGRWVDQVDLERWSGGGRSTFYNLVEVAGLVEQRQLQSDEGSFMQYRLWGLVHEEFPRGRRSRRMQFAVGHPLEIELADFSKVGFPPKSVVRSLEHLSRDEVVEYVNSDAPVLIACQDPRALDAMAPDDWDDLQARLVLAREEGILVPLTDTEAQDIMEEYEARLQSLSELIHQRVALSDDA